MMNIQIGIEGGGSSSLFFFRDLDTGDQTRIAGPALQMSESDLATITEAIHQIIQSFTNKRAYSVKRICGGISGAGGSGFRLDLENKLSQKYGCEVDIMSDAEATWFHHFGHDKRGILCINGTGSVIVTKREHQLKTYGGYGPQSYEPLSGREIGRKAINHLMQVLDFEKKDDAALILMKKMGVYNRKELLSLLYHSDFKPSDLAKSIIESAEDSCEFFQNIITSEIKGLIQILKKIPPADYDKHVFALHGGLHSNDYLRKQFIRGVLNEFNDAEFLVDADISKTLAFISDTSIIPRFTS